MAPTASSRRPNTGGLLRASGVPVAFLLLAALFWIDPIPHHDPTPERKQTPDWATDTTPLRTPSLKPELVVAVYTYRCSECHKLFASPPETLRPLTQHREIPREHGINNRCFNCHHREDRNAFVDDKGAPLPYDQPQLLCARCHGPVYRDWTHGVHGRSSGYWDTERGEMRRLKCIECHDPHAPAVGGLAPAPGPNTLRMGTPHPRPREDSDNPLVIHRRGGDSPRKESE